MVKFNQLGPVEYIILGFVVMFAVATVVALSP